MRKSAHSNNAVGAASTFDGAALPAGHRLGTSDSLSVQFSRRSRLSMTGSALGMLALSGFRPSDRLFAAPPKTVDRAMGGSVILHLLGGPSAKETWDPDLNSPVEYRGPYKPTRTAVPGLFISELWPQVAKRFDQVSVLSAVDAGTADHVPGLWNLMNPDQNNYLGNKMGQAAGGMKGVEGLNGLILDVQTYFFGHIKPYVPRNLVCK